MSDSEGSEGFQSLHLLLLRRDSGPELTNSVYTKLADVPVADESIFGAMLLERQPAGTFVVVYFAGGGSLQDNSLVVFRFQAERARASRNHN